MITNEIMERILAERDAKHKAELEKVRAEVKMESMEMRLRKLEEQADQEDEETEPSIAGFKMSDIVQAVMAYTSMQTQTPPKK